MKDNIISEVVNNIDDDYIDEALEFHTSDVINMKTNRKHKILVVGIAASLTLALGVTAYAAGVFMMSKRDAEPSETITREYVIDDDEIETVVYDDVSKLITFEGLDECNEIEFKANDIPSEYNIEFGDSDDWNMFLQGVREDGHCFNIQLFYTSEFGDNGSLFLTEETVLEEEITEGDYQIYKFETIYEPEYIEGWYDPEEDLAEPAAEYYYLMYNTSEGYLIVVSSSVSMADCEQIAAGLEIRETGEVITYNPNEAHDFYLCNGVG